MDNFLNPSPNGLNSFNTGTSPFSDEAFGAINFEENIFSKSSEIEPEEQVENPIKKRINDYDANILNKYTPVEIPSFKSRLLNFFKKKSEFSLKIESLEDFIYLIFPDIYKTKMMKESLKKLITLNKIANELITKKIPYGENQEHYSDLISSLATATNIQADLKKRM